MSKIFKGIVFIVMTGAILGAFLVDIDFIPALGNRARNLFFHVPMSWVAVIAFLMSMVYSIMYLRTKDLDTDLKAYASAEIGFLFCLLAMLTGMIWSKIDWGVFLKLNDPRIMSVLILLLIYGAYLVLRSAIEEHGQRARLSAVYLIIAFLTVPFFIFIMPRIFPGLHPGSSDDADSPGGGPVVDNMMSPGMRIIFYLSCVAFILVYFCIYNLKLRSERLSLQRTQIQNG